MKKRNSIIMFIAVVFVFAAFSSSASLPELEAPATPTPMPFTISPEGSNYGYIDVNGDDIIDFTIYYSGSSVSGSFNISSYNSGNEIHYASLLSSPDGNEPLGYVPSIAKVLDEGDEIGSNLTQWDSFERLFYYSQPSGPILTDNFYNKSSGYLGVKFIDDGETYYGWIQASRTMDMPTGTLTSSGASVTVYAAAAASSPGSSILAGSGGAVVPVPVIASALGFFAIGTGLYFRRKRKKA